MEGISKLSPDARTQLRHFSRASERRVRLHPFRGARSQSLPHLSGSRASELHGEENAHRQSTSSERRSAGAAAKGAGLPCVRARAHPLLLRHLHTAASLRLANGVSLSQRPRVSISASPCLCLRVPVSLSPRPRVSVSTSPCLSLSPPWPCARVCSAVSDSLWPPGL